MQKFLKLFTLSIYTQVCKVFALESKIVYIPSMMCVQHPTILFGTYEIKSTALIA